MPLTRDQILQNKSKFKFTYDQYISAKINDKLPCICMHCGKIKMVQKRYLVGLLYKNIFCCVQCAHAYHNHYSVLVTCECCGKQFYKNKSSIKDHVFCSHACSAKVMNKTRVYKRYQTKAELLNCTIAEAKRVVKNESNIAKNKRCVENRKKNRVCSVCGTVGCTNPICKIYSFRHEYELAKRFGMHYNNKGTLQHIAQYDVIRENIVKALKEVDNSLCKFMIKYNIPEIKTALNFLKSFNIHCNKDVLLSKNVKRFCRGYHTTWENKTYFYRSSYELEYMKYLDEQRVSYEAATKMFTYYNTQLARLCKAYPDIILPQQKTVVEIKSFYTYNQQEMKDKQKAYEHQGYKFKLILEHEEYDYCPKDLFHDAYAWTDVCLNKHLTQNNIISC